MQRSAHLMAALATALLGLPIAVSTAAAQEPGLQGSAVTLSSRNAALELELSDGAERLIEFRGGQLRIDGKDIASYESGGSLERGWRTLLRQPELMNQTTLRESLDEWRSEWPEWNEQDSAAALALGKTLDRLLGRTAHTAAADPSQLAGGLPEAASVISPSGEPLTIAPGMLNLQALTQSLERLRVSLQRLDLDAEAASERLALLVHDDYAIAANRVVPGNLALLSGELALDGTVRGDVLVLDGDLMLGPSAVIDGDLVLVGGKVEQLGGRITGELLELSFVDGMAANIEADIAADLQSEADEIRAVQGDIGRASRRDRDRRGRGFLGHIRHNVGQAVGGIFAAMMWLLGLAALGFGVVHFFRKRLETIADTVRADFGRSFGVGLGGQLLSLPILLVLVVGVVTWLAIPFYVLALILAAPLAYLAVAHTTGEVLHQRDIDWLRRFRPARPNSFYYVLIGLAALIAPFAVGSALYLLGGMVGFLRGLVFFAAGLLTWVAWTSGFGAVILTRAGQRKLYPSGLDRGDEDLFDSPEASGTHA